MKMNTKVERGSNVKLRREQLGTICYSDLLRMLKYFAPTDRGCWIWIISQSVYPCLVLLTDERGNSALIHGCGEDREEMIFGFPIYWDDQSPLLGTTGDIVLTDQHGTRITLRGSDELNARAVTAAKIQAHAITATRQDVLDSGDEDCDVRHILHCLREAAWKAHCKSIQILEEIIGAPAGYWEEDEDEGLPETEG